MREKCRGLIPTVTPITPPVGTHCVCPPPIFLYAFDLINIFWAHAVCPYGSFPDTIAKKYRTCMRYFLGMLFINAMLEQPLKILLTG